MILASAHSQEQSKPQPGKRQRKRAKHNVDQRECLHIGPKNSKRTGTCKHKSHWDPQWVWGGGVAVVWRWDGTRWGDVHHLPTTTQTSGGRLGTRSSVSVMVVLRDPSQLVRGSTEARGHSRQRGAPFALSLALYGLMTPARSAWHEQHPRQQKAPTVRQGLSADPLQGHQITTGALVGDSGVSDLRRRTPAVTRVKAQTAVAPPLVVIVVQVSIAGRVEQIAIVTSHYGFTVHHERS